MIFYLPLIISKPSFLRAPHSPCHVCTAGEDSQALIWDLSSMPKQPIDDPILAYNAEGEINNLQWSSSMPDWVSISFYDKLQIRKFTSHVFCITVLKYTIAFFHLQFESKLQG